MTIEQRFAELQAFMMRYPRLDAVAEEAVARLRRKTDCALQAAADAPDQRDELYKELWDAIVEPADHPVERTGQPTRDARMMAREGIVIDHVLTLWLFDAKWRKLTNDLVGVAA